MTATRIADYLKKSSTTSVDPKVTLVLDGLKIKTFTPEDVAELKKYENTATSLSMNQCSLTSLSGLPSFPLLEVLEMHDNKLQGAEVFQEIALKMPKLESLLMAGNKVNSMTHLEPLRQLEHLFEIDLEMNPVMSSVTREAVFEMLPKLEVVNGFTKDGKEIEEEKSEDEEENNEAANGAGGSLLATLMNGKFDDDDDDDLEDYVPESDEFDSEASIDSAANAGTETAAAGRANAE